VLSRELSLILATMQITVDWKSDRRRVPSSSISAGRRRERRGGGDSCLAVKGRFAVIRGWRDYTEKERVSALFCCWGEKGGGDTEFSEEKLSGLPPARR